MSSTIGLHELVDLTIPLFDSKDLRTLLHKLIKSNEEGMSMAVALNGEIKELKNQLSQQAKKTTALEQHFHRQGHLDVGTAVALNDDLLQEIEELKNQLSQQAEKTTALEQHLHRQEHLDVVTAVALNDELRQEIKELKNQHSQQAERATFALEQILHRLEHLDVVTGELQGKVAQCPHSDERGQFVTWDVLQAALVSERQKLQKPLTDVGSLTETYGELEARTELLEEGKAEQTQPQQQSDLLGGEEITDLAADSDSGESPMKQELGCLRNTVHKLGEEVQKLKREDGKVKSRASKDGNMQDQLDKLRSMLEDMMASSSSQEEGRPVCPSTSVDVSKKVSQLFERYEKLQGMVTDMQEQGGSKANFVSQQAQLMVPMQRSISKLLGECEKLHRSTHCLMEENSQKQRHIDHLYKSVEELDEKKIDMGQVKVEMEIEADKQALARKVNRVQFDRTTGHLNCMFKEVISKISMQEQDWHKVIQRISTEMESKLNRIELDSLKQELEAHWKDLHQQLQAPPAPEPDSAAGFRKQLVDRLHCISCDHPLDMLTSGQHLDTVPSAPGLHGHKSTWPYRIHQLEQVRQHCRSPKPRTSCNGFERDPVERSVAQLRPHHMTCQRVEKAPLQSAAAGVSERQQSPGLKEQGRTRFPPIHRTSQSPAKLELVPEKAGCRFPPLSRSCGGSHTITHPSHRGHIAHIYNSRVNTCAPFSAQEDVARSKDRVACTKLKRLAGLELSSLTLLPPQRAKGSCSGSTSSARYRPMSSILSQPPNLAETPTNEPQGKAHNRDLSQSEDEPVTTEFFLTSLSQ